MPPTVSPVESTAAAPVAADVRGRRRSSFKATADLVRFSFEVDRTAYILTIGAAFAGSLAEGAVLLMLLPLLAAAGMSFPGQTLPGRLAAFSQSLLERSGLPHAVWLPAVLGIFLLLGAARSVLRRSQMTLTYATTNAVGLTLSRRVYAAVVRARWAYLVRQRSGRLTHLLTEQLQRVSEVIALSLSLINLLCLTVLYLAMALKLSVVMTALVLALGALLLLLQRHAVRRSRDTGYALNESIGEVFAATEEHLLNLKSVKTYEAEERDIEHFASLCETVVRHSMASARNQAGAAFRFELGSLVALAAVVFLALGVLHVASATLLLLLGVFTRLMPQLAALQSQGHEFVVALPAYDTLLALEADCTAHAELECDPADRTVPALRRSLRAEDIWFAYLERSAGESSGPEHVLRGLSLEVQAGTLTAIAGPSGAGKSTVADILNGLLSPARGRILIDGVELTPALLGSWRRHVGYVGQDTVLFHQTIRENLLWARPGASESELREALELASAEFVYGLSAGLDTIAGDRGVLLSGGQRQRIALARAFLRRPSLLILDEATNALDYDNEQRILDALLHAIAARQGSLTVVMIAHRASALERADRVITIDGGRQC